MTELNVSRETQGKLRSFADLVAKWTPTINLISRNSIAHIWERHIIDSAQLYKLAPPAGLWVDLGSGGGFPGIVVAILSEEKATHEVVLVESDHRKAAFLRTAIRELGLPAKVISARIADVEPLNADILSARALAELDVLLDHAEKHMAPRGTALFMKGETWEKEMEAARLIWSYDCEPITSVTNPAAAVLKIQEISRV